MEKNFWSYFNTFEEDRDINSIASKIEEIEILLELYKKDILKAIPNLKEIIGGSNNDKKTENIITFINKYSSQDMSLKYRQNDINYIKDKTIFIIFKKDNEIIATISLLQMNVIDKKKNVKKTHDSAYVENLCVNPVYRYLNLHYYLILKITHTCLCNNIYTAFFNIKMNIRKNPYTFSKNYIRFLETDVSQNRCSYMTRMYKNLTYSYNYNSTFKKTHTCRKLKQDPDLEIDKIVENMNLFKDWNYELYTELSVDNINEFLFKKDQFDIIGIFSEGFLKAVFIFNKLEEGKNKYQHILQHCYYDNICSLNNIIELLSEFLYGEGCTQIVLSLFTEYNQFKTLKIVEQDIILNHYCHSFTEKIKSRTPENVWIMP